MDGAMITTNSIEYVCGQCGSDRIESTWEVWIDPNTFETIEDNGNPTNQRHWCRECYEKTGDGETSRESLKHWEWLQQETSYG